MADTYDLVPYLTNHTAAHRALLRAARSQTVRLGVVGDSQETNPGGQGGAFISALSRTLHRAIGNTPETPIAPPVSFTGGTTVWMLRGTAANGTDVSATYASELPPLGSAFDADNGLGFILQLQPAADMTTKTGGPTYLAGGTYWDRAASTYIEYLVATRATSDQIAWTAQPNDSRRVNYFADVTASGTTALAGLSSGTWAVQLARVGPLPWNGKLNMQVTAKASGANAVRLVGARYVNATNPAGFAVTPLSAGGYTASRFSTDHADVGEWLRAAGFHGYLLCFGTNDAYTLSRTPADFKSALEAEIAFIRAAHDGTSITPLFWVVADPYRAGGTGTQDGYFDQYPGVAAEIADANTDVCAVNMRRVLDETAGVNATYESDTGLTDQGEWSDASVSYVVGDLVTVTGMPTTYWRCVEAHTSSAGNGPGSNTGNDNWQEHRRFLADGVHLTPMGQVMQAETLASALLTDAAAVEPPTAAEIVAAINADATQTTARTNAATAATQATTAAAQTTANQQQANVAAAVGSVPVRVHTVRIP